MDHGVELRCVGASIELMCMYEPLEALLTRVYAGIPPDSIRITRSVYMYNKLISLS